MRKITPKKMDDTAKPMPMPHEIYPRFSIELMHLPEAKNWKVGNTYEIGLRVKQVGLHMGKNSFPGDTADFEIVGIEPGEQIKGGGKRYEDKDNG